MDTILSSVQLIHLYLSARFLPRVRTDRGRQHGRTRRPAGHGLVAGALWLVHARVVGVGLSRAALCRLPRVGEI